MLLRAYIGVRREILYQAAPVSSDGEDVGAASIPLASPGLRIRSNFAWALAGNVAAAAAQWAVVVLLARLADAASVGQYTLGLAIASPVFTLASLNLRGLQATDLKSEFRFADYFAIRMAATLLAMAVTAAVLICGNYSLTTALVVMGVALARSLESASDVFYGHWQQHEQMDRIGKSMMLRGAASIAAVSVVLVSRPSAVWGTAVLVVVSAAVLTGYEFPRLDVAARLEQAALPEWRTRLKKLAELARLAGPLGLAPMLATLNAHQPRYWLAHHRTETDVGIYSALAYATVAANLVVMALGQAAGPAMTRALDEGDLAGFRRQAGRLAAVGLGFGAAGMLLAWLCGEPLIEWCYGPGFQGHGGNLVWLMTAGAFSYLASCAGYTLTAARRFLVQIPVLCAGAAAIAVGCWVLVPELGVRGAAMAQTAGSALQFVLLGGMALVLTGAYRNR